MEADGAQSRSGFRPGIMQWVFAALLVLVVLIPVISGGFNLGTIIIGVVLLAVWIYWVWREPNGGQMLVVPLLASLTAFIVGAAVIALAAGQGAPVGDRLSLAVRGYAALVDGAFLKERALTNTLVAATPFIMMGLAVAVGFRAGLFNIGAEGQFMMGAVCAVFVGYAIKLPLVLHAIVAMAAGALGGAVWGYIPGWLKAKLGAHEVINTIMMNFIAIQLADWLINNPMKDPDESASVIRTPFIYDSARLPKFSELGSFGGIFPPADRLHIGFILSLAVAFGVWWLLWKTTIGFELRTAGANPHAARYAGMKADASVILAMSISGALAGLAGAFEIQGLNRMLPAFFSSGFGFTSIAVALLGQNHPVGIIPSAILFGALRTGSDVLQIRTGVSRHMVSIIQALILLFVAAPAMVRWLYRLRVGKADMEEVPLTRGWGG